VWWVWIIGGDRLDGRLEPVTFGVSVWIATWAPLASATRKRVNQTESCPVLVQLESAAPPRSCSQRLLEAVLPAEEHDVDRAAVEGGVHARERRPRA
jgi:hypothetical protein